MLNLRSARKKMKINQKQLAKKLDVAPSTVSQWENNTRQPDNNMLGKISTLLNVSTDYLLGLSSNSNIKSIYANGEIVTTVKVIPVLGSVPAGIPIEAIEDIIDEEEIDSQTASLGELFGLKVQGDSMEPRIKAGDVLIVLQTTTAETGDIVIAMIAGECTVKKYVRHENGVSLIPFNTTYSPKFYTKKEIATFPIEIIGKVVELRAKF